MGRSRGSSVAFATAYVVLVFGLFLALGGAAYAQSPSSAGDQYGTKVAGVKVSATAGSETAAAASNDHHGLEKLITKAEQRYTEVGSELAKHFITHFQKAKHPKHRGPKPPFEEQEKQKYPGTEAKMQPKADHGEQSYRGSAKLTDRAALITFLKSL